MQRAPWFCTLLIVAGWSTCSEEAVALDWVPQVVIPGATDLGTRLWISQIFDSFGESVTFNSLFILPQAQDSGFEVLMSRMRTALQDPNMTNTIDWVVVTAVLTEIKATYAIPASYSTQFDNVLSRVSGLAQADQSALDTQVFGTTDAIVNVLRQIGDMMVSVAQDRAPPRVFRVPYAVTITPYVDPAAPAVTPPAGKPKADSGLSGQVSFIRQFSNGSVMGIDGTMATYGAGSMWQASESFTPEAGVALPLGTVVTITLDPDSTIFSPDLLVNRVRAFTVTRNRNLTWAKDNLRGLFIDQQENVLNTQTARYGNKVFDQNYRYDVRIKEWTDGIRKQRYGDFFFPHFDLDGDGWISRTEWMLWQAAESIGTIAATNLAMDIGGSDYAARLTVAPKMLVLREQIPAELQAWLPSATPLPVAPEEWIDPSLYVRALQAAKTKPTPTPAPTPTPTPAP